MGRKIVRGWDALMVMVASASLLLTHQTPLPHSRPRTVEDVAHQEEVVKTLQKALHTANVCWCIIHLECCCCSAYMPPPHTTTVAPLAVLWTTWYWKNHHSTRHFSTALWVRWLDGMCERVCLLMYGVCNGHIMSDDVPSSWRT